MAFNRAKNNKRRTNGHFALLPYAVISSPNFRLMSGFAVKLLIQMMAQIRFRKGGETRNNGDLCVSWTLMKDQGWRSKDTLYRAREELLYYGFIEQTRQGMAMVKGKPYLYALTFLAIDECGGKLDVPETATPSGKCKEEKKRYKPPDKKNRQPSTPPTTIDR
ncbi:hypothetical protein ACH42_05250 [Endozoicomonas sp. (ex Bugula neritina AB1)]|nr:hypothetical protein ACH42_05250 [Endozoicomonas sp. (ex Bugula neritina AB1)]